MSHLETVEYIGNAIINGNIVQAFFVIAFLIFLLHLYWKMIGEPTVRNNMKLEPVDVPNYELILPSSKEPITVRPFLVKEEKLLLLALASEDLTQIITTTEQIVSACVVEWPEGKDITKIPFFDVDYLFIALRAKSVGDTLDVSFTCHNQVQVPYVDKDGIGASGEEIMLPTDCGEIFTIPIDIANIELENAENASKLIKLNEKFSVKLVCPPYRVMRAISDRDDNYESRVRLIASCIDRIYQGESIITRKEFSPMECIAWVEGLTQEHFKKLEEFIDHFPSFFVEGEGTCPKCSYHHKVRYDDFESFFTS